MSHPWYGQPTHDNFLYGHQVSILKRDIKVVAWPGAGVRLDMAPQLCDRFSNGQHSAISNQPLAGGHGDPGLEGVFGVPRQLVADS